MRLLKLAPMLLIAAALGGCGDLDWDHMTSYVGLGDDKPAAPPPEQAPANDSVPTSSAQPEQYQPWTPVGTTESKPTAVTATPLASPQTNAVPVPQAEPVAQAAPQTYVAPAPQTYVASAPRAEPVAQAAPQTYVAPAPQAEPVAQAAPQAVASAQPPAVYAPATPADAAAGDSFCQAAAQSASQDAANQGFDAATQRNRAVMTYNQCVRYGH